MGPIEVYDERENYVVLSPCLAKRKGSSQRQLRQATVISAAELRFGRRNKPILRPEAAMDEDLSYAIPCSSVAVDSVLRVGTAGAIWGLCIGPYDARKIGLTGAARAAFVAKSAGSFGFKCGLFSGIFSITHCGVMKYRRRNDWVNGFVAGAVAGAAIAARTRSLTQIVGMAGLISVFGVAADYSRSP